MESPTAAAPRSGAEFQRRLTLHLALLSVPPIALLVVYVGALVRFTGAHHRVFLMVIAANAVVVFPLFTATYSRLYRRIGDVLDRMTAGTASDEEVRRAYRDVNAIPQTIFVRGMLMWAFAATSVPAGTALLTDGLGASSLLSIAVALLSGGVLLEILLAFAAKRTCEAERLRLAAAIADPDERERSLRPLALFRKLRVSLVAVSLVTVCSAVLLAQVRATDDVERHAAGLQARLLQQAGDDPDPSQLAALQARARELGLARDLALIAPDAGAALWGDAGILAPLEWEEVRHDPHRTGDGTAFRSPNVFSWRRLPDGRLLVAALPGSAVFEGDRAQAAWVLAVVGIAGVLAWLVAWALADDVGRAMRSLTEQARAIAGGDLRGETFYDAEDELGALGRTFDRMRGGLRELVSGVDHTAARLETATGRITSVADGVQEASEGQTRALGDAGSSVERIHERTRGIAGSAEALGRAVEESTSAAHELGAVGNELTETAAGLSVKVDTVSSAVEQMAASIKEVARSTDALAEAAGDTSASMEQVASSVREVETHAGTTSALSERMVGAAERGRERVAQTMAGMQAIQRETETARGVVADLGSRATEIGGILEVITDVADETNLLALNAAIISAQAGEQGRAFAVVADQIKALADRVLASTREIEERVRSVQSGTRNAVSAIERGAQAVTSGVALSQEAGESLDEITEAARGSGERIAGIVAAIREQSKAAGHVVGLMEQLQGVVERIRRASLEQDRGNELILAEVVDMRHASERVSRTAREQQEGAGRIRDAFESVRSSVDAITTALKDQVEACARSTELFEGMRQRVEGNAQAVGEMTEVSRALDRDADRLRQDVRRFRI